MTKFVVIGVAVAVFLLDVAPAFTHYRAYGYRAYGYYGAGFRAYGYYGYRPYRYYLPAELHRQYDRNSTAFNS